MFVFNGGLFGLEKGCEVARAQSGLDLVHTDLAEPTDLWSINSHEYAMSLTYDHTTLVFVFFLKAKCDTLQAIPCR